MRPARFTYHQPRTVDDALTALAQWAPEGGRILAGGQSLVPMMAFRLAQPAHLIDINGIPGLDQVCVRDGMLRIPACVRHARFDRPVVDGPLGALLSAVTRHVAHLPIRTRGTFCGSLANADPASEWCAVFAALDGEAVLQSRLGGERTIPAARFFRSIMTTALRHDEMLLEARLPLLPPGTRWGFEEHSRRAGDYAQSMTVAAYALRDGRIAAPRLAVGGAEACPRRIPEAEAALDGAPPTPDTFRCAADAAADAVDAMEDAQIPAALRRDLVRATTRRALLRSAAQGPT